MDSNQACSQTQQQVKIKERDHPDYDLTPKYDYTFKVLHHNTTKIIEKTHDNFVSINPPGQKSYCKQPKNNALQFELSF